MKLRTCIVMMAGALSLSTSVVLAAPSGVAVVKWLEGQHTIEAFADAGTELTTPSQITTNHNGIITIYAKDGAGNTAIHIVTVDIPHPNRPRSSGHGGGGTTIILPANKIDEQNKAIRYIKGYPDNTFRPDSPISRAEMAVILARLLPNTPTPIDFPDTNGHWAQTDIAQINGLGYLKGYEDATFRPDTPITRAEAAALICRVFGSKLIGEENYLFTDIAEHWAAEHIGRLAKSGCLSGYPDRTFRPNNSITRAEMVKLINAVIDNQPDSVAEQHFADIPKSHWAFGNIEAAVIR